MLINFEIIVVEVYFLFIFLFLRLSGNIRNMKPRPAHLTDLNKRHPG